ncbi:MAG: lytic transglycosylase domain-containing protein, partial [Methylococcaceae bacterium]
MKFVVILTMLLSSTQVIADIYKFVDTDGRIYYTDEPRNKLYKCIIKTPPPSPPFAFRNDHYKNQNFTGSNKKKFAELIEQTAYKHQVDAKLVHAVIQTESAYNADAQSPKGAVGLMQLMPDTAKRFGVLDRNDPDQNVDGGIRYLKHLIALFNPKIDLALA